MDELIEALTILKKYQSPLATYPTACEHDVLYVVYIDTVRVSLEDNVRLKRLGFYVSETEEDAYYSNRFGSA